MHYFKKLDQDSRLGLIQSEAILVWGSSDPGVIQLSDYLSDAIGGRVNGERKVVA